MNAAISELTIALETMETNEPINRANGNTEQADLEASNAADLRQALEILKAASNGPIWPEPKAGPLDWRVRRPVEKRKDIGMKRPRTYSVTPSNETPEEPSIGIYWTHEDDDGETVVHGPYRNKWDAEEAIDRWQFNQGECPHD